jgi:hypothetical protein
MSRKLLDLDLPRGRSSRTVTSGEKLIKNHRFEIIEAAD